MAQNIEVTPDLESAFKKALEAQKNAYAPYSNYKVGACIIGQSGESFIGCNIENASYGGTVCAERVAIFNAVSSGKAQKLKAIVLVTQNSKAAAPCGFCRQVLSEFVSADFPIYLANQSEIQKKTTLGELLPMAFSPDALKK